MGRLTKDFYDIYNGMGLKNALQLVLFPRILRKVGINYNDSQTFDRFIEKNFNKVISKYKQTSFFKECEIPKTIWVFWWQGELAMPSVIKECYRSILRNANGRQVILLDHNNYKDYVKLPDYILRKSKDGIISKTHFSDLLRVCLLKEYGGFWIDAAIFVTKPIPQYKGIFYSPRLTNELQDSPHMAQWVMGVMGAPPHMPLFLYIYDMLLSYWAKYNVVFSYLMFDYFIKYGYEHIAWIKEIMENRPVESPDLHFPRYNFSEEVDEKKLDCLLVHNTFLSLTYRIKYPKYTINGKESYYAALLNKYNIKYDEKSNGGVNTGNLSPLNQWLHKIKLLFDSIHKRLIIFRYKYWQWRDREMAEYIKKLRIMSIEETVDYIIKNKSSCTRFGDGEFLVLVGQFNQFQKKDKKLADRLKEVIENKVDSLLVCMPSFITNVKPFVLNSQLTGLGFNHSYLKTAVKPYVSVANIYGDSLFTRFYMNKKDKSKTPDYIKTLKRLWEGEKLLIVEGKYSRLGVSNDLFDNTISIKRILCPQENAFDRYDIILSCIKQYYQGELIILALGMTATILAYDLAKEKMRALDLGHIDVEYEWYRMGATHKLPISGKQMSECQGGDCHSSSSNIRYLKQIIADCSS